MPGRGKGIEAILECLYDELSWGVLWLQITKTLQAMYEDDQVPVARHFFAGAYHACLREFLLCFSRLTEERPDSVTIHYLLNCAEQLGKAFPCATDDDIKKSVGPHREQLAALAPLMDAVRKQRDKVLAHLDRDQINKPTATYPAINLSDVERSFDEFLKMVNTYRGYYDGNQYSFDVVELEVAEDVAYLSALMRSAQD